MPNIMGERIFWFIWKRTRRIDVICVAVTQYSCSVPPYFRYPHESGTFTRSRLPTTVFEFLICAACLSSLHFPSLLKKDRSNECGWSCGKPVIQQRCHQPKVEHRWDIDSAGSTGSIGAYRMARWRKGKMFSVVAVCEMRFFKFIWVVI